MISFSVVARYGLLPVVDKLSEVGRCKAENALIYCVPMNYYVIESMCSLTRDTFLASANAMPIFLRDVLQIYPQW